MSRESEIEELKQRRRWAEELGGAKSVARENELGRLTIRERIDKLADPGSFQEVGKLAGRGVYEGGIVKHVTPAPYLAGLAEINGRTVAIGGEDYTVRGGSSPGLARRKGGQGGFIDDLAFEYRIPLINLCHGSGGSVTSLRRLGYAPLPGNDGWERAVDLLGQVPVVGAVFGTSAGGPAIRAVLSHWSVMIRKTSHVMTAGPRLVARSLGEKVTKDELGSAETAVDLAGTIHDAVDTEEECFAAIRRFLSYMPQNVWELPPVVRTGDPPDRIVEELRHIVPESRMHPYDMRRVVELTMDKGSLFEIQSTYGKAVITCLARLDGVPVGVIANNPKINGGALDVAASRKQAHFIELCDCFHIPLIFLMDTPGFMIGSRAEKASILREATSSVYAGIQATVPFFTVIVRKCYGLAGLAGQHKRGIDLKLAWPSAEWGSLPVEGGVAVAFKSEIENAPDPKVKEREIEDELKALASPFRTAEAFGVEDIIDPCETRAYLARFIRPAYNSMTARLGPKLKAGVRP